MTTLLSGQLLFSALVLAALYALLAVGLNLVYGTMRLLNIAHGDLAMIGAYVAYGAFTLFGVPPLVILPVAAAIAALIGHVLYRGLFKRLIDQGGPIERLESNSLLVFFGVSIVMQNLMALAFTATPRAYNFWRDVVEVGGVRMSVNRLSILIVSAAALIAILLFLKRTVHGMAIKALIQNRKAAQIVGVDVERTQRLAFHIGFGSAGVAGALLSMTEQITPFMGFPFTVTAFLVIILGQLGNIWGSIIGAIALAVVQTYGVALTSSTYSSVLLYGLFVLTIVLLPQGLLRGLRSAR